MSTPISLSKSIISDALGTVLIPDGRTLIGSDSAKWISACDGFAALKLSLPDGMGPRIMPAVAESARIAIVAAAAQAGSRVESLSIEFVDNNGDVLHAAKFGSGPAAPASPPPTAPTPAAGHTPIGGLGPPKAAAAPTDGKPPMLPGVRKIIAVGAGKGGVGKSTVSLNLAVGLARRGHAVGLLDGDIYGPSMPTMLGLTNLETVVHQGMLQPFYVHGIKCMTIGKLVDPEKPLIWRGPMAHGAFKQLTEQTSWGELDYLIIDLPPGTGDVSLTMAQLLPVAGAVVVCTPQRVAQDDAVRAARMFKQLNIEVLGVIENMSYFVGDDGTVYDLFGKGGAETMAQRLNVPFLGAIPITTSLRINSDKGDPTANFTATDPSGARLAQALEGIITQAENQVALADMRIGNTRPVLKVS